MTENEIRKNFIDFFLKHNHKLFISSSLVPDDPTLLFTTAGMVQMMPYLLRQEDISKNPRACSVQKSFRTTDIDDIGNDGRHLTFFEMLGSWSFGDYYKEEAISLAIELLVNEFGLLKDKIWVTVFVGDNKIPKDIDSYNHWISVGIPKERIVALGWEDNFWGPPGLEGPCGPSTEIYYDMGKEVGCGEETCAPGCDCDRFIEVWNAGVFMEYYKDVTGNYSKLPYTNVDTGAGLERMAALLQGKNSVFETDLFTPIIKRIEHVSDKRYGDYKRQMNIIADHIKASAFLIVDGVFPSNLHRGYVLRRLIRRSMIQIYSMNLPMNNNVINATVDAISDIYGVEYKEVSENKDRVKSILGNEIEGFVKVLSRSVKVLDKVVKDNKISGESMFLLHDTYGLNIEILKDILTSRNISFDETGFLDLMRVQKSKSKMSSSFTLGKEIEVEYGELPKTQFLGYLDLTVPGESKVLKVVDMQNFVSFVLDKTSFYAESGGQVGDVGKVLGRNIIVNVKSVRKTKSGVFVHFGEYEPRSDKLKTGEIVSPIVDKIVREKISHNHTAVHLLSVALHKTLDIEIIQKGSFIDKDRLRFDFSFDRSLTDDEIKSVENIINSEINNGDKIEIIETSLDEARRMGVPLAFEDRYTNDVRIIKIGDFSMELCGGTHFGFTSDLGTFNVDKQEPVGRGIRRIRASLS